MFKWLMNCFRREYRYRYHIQVTSFPWGFAYTFRIVHSLRGKEDIASSVLSKGCIYRNGDEFRQFKTPASDVSLSDIQGSNKRVGERYGKLFCRFLEEVEKFCTEGDPTIVDFHLKEELVADFKGLERLDWMINEGHFLTLRSFDGKRATEFAIEELSRPI